MLMILCKALLSISTFWLNKNFYLCFDHHLQRMLVSPNAKSYAECCVLSPSIPMTVFGKMDYGRCDHPLFSDKELLREDCTPSEWWSQISKRQPTPNSLLQIQVKQDTEYIVPLFSSVSPAMMLELLKKKCNCLEQNV